MAKSPAHGWGQVVGGIFETAFHAFLAEVATKSDVYLDHNGNERSPTCGVRNDRNCLAWKDENDNWHQLDFVFERGGTSDAVGTPVGFVEIAWRRYTKHSKNKAQEIEGAVLPLAETHRHARPFLGAIVGGVFTGNSLNQLRSRGFAVIYVGYASVVAAFAEVGIDASYDEDTPDSDYEEKLAKWAELSESQKATIQVAIVTAVADQVEAFAKQLHASIDRTVTLIRVLPLHGEASEMSDRDAAIAFVSTYNEAPKSSREFIRYEIIVRYSNGAVISGAFPTKSEAAAFLRTV